MSGRKARVFIVHGNEDQVCHHQEAWGNTKEATPMMPVLTHKQTNMRETDVGKGEMEKHREKMRYARDHDRAPS